MVIHSALKSQRIRIACTMDSLGDHEKTPLLAWGSCWGGERQGWKHRLGPRIRGTAGLTKLPATCPGGNRQTPEIFE